MVEWWVKWRLVNGKEGVHGPYRDQREAEAALMGLPLKDGDEAWTVRRSVNG